MAESNIYFDLSEEIEQDLLYRYSSLCDELSQKLNAMRQELEEICTAVQYEPIVNVINTTITLFNDDIYTVAYQTFDEWIDGEGSFSTASENSQSGESALETARQIETSIKDLFESFWSSHPLGEEVQIDTSRPKVKDENFDELKDVYTRFYQDVETISEDSANSFAEAGSDDPTYNVIIPAVKAITGPIKEAFEQFSTKIDEAKEKSESLKQQQNSKNEEALQIAKDTSGTAADVSQALNMFDDI